MKYILTLLLCGLMLFSLAGCRRGVEQETNESELSSVPESSLSEILEEVSDAESALPSEPSSEEPISSEAETVTITFAEGTTLPKMFMILEEKGVADQDALFETAQYGDFSDISLVSAIPFSAERCYRLEGYLFPDTYEFYIGEKPESILRKMLKNTSTRLTAEYSARAAELGMSMDQAIILASLIQKEAGSVSEMARVSSVLHNRLDAGMRLQCDASITYVEYVIKPFIEGDKDRYNEFYNTYKCSELPAGPIGNPGMAALEAALWPADTNYYFFAMDSAGTHYYSETYEEHVAVCTEHGIGIHG